MKLNIALYPHSKSQPYSIPRFEALFELHYLKHLEFEDWKTEHWIKNHCLQAEKRGKIEQLALWLGKFHAKDIIQASIAPIDLRWIDEKIGYGIFATKTLKKWQYIGEYTGILKKRQRFHRNINDYCFMYPKYWRSLKSYTIDSQYHGNYTRFINHSDFPNCESVAVYHEGIFHIIFRTIREIREHEQLTYDYGDIYWRRRKKLETSAFE